MKLMSYQHKAIVVDLLQQIDKAIDNLAEWNKEYACSNDFLTSPSGMKTLAADCMLIEAIGDGLKKIDSKTDGQLLPLRSEIPWKQVKGMRDHIAHGYFDINVDFVWDVIENDIEPLRQAIRYFINYLETDDAPTTM